MSSVASTAASEIEVERAESVEDITQTLASLAQLRDQGVISAEAYVGSTWTGQLRSAVLPRFRGRFKPSGLKKQDRLRRVQRRSASNSPVPRVFLPAAYRLDVSSAAGKRSGMVTIAGSRVGTLGPLAVGTLFVRFGPEGFRGRFR
jgi:hypothetical protein